jgi:hypothetical protein
MALERRRPDLFSFADGDVENRRAVDANDKSGSARRPDAPRRHARRGGTIEQCLFI